MISNMISEISIILSFRISRLFLEILKNISYFHWFNQYCGNRRNINLYNCWKIVITLSKCNVEKAGFVYSCH